MRQLRFILTLLLGSTIWGNVELSLINYSEAEGTAEVFFNSDVEIGGFQFDLEGAELTGKAFASLYGPAGTYIVTLVVVLFAFSSIPKLIALVMA